MGRSPGPRSVAPTAPQETTETFVDAHDHYEMLEQLGRGSVATVRQHGAEHCETPKNRQF